MVPSALRERNLEGVIELMELEWVVEGELAWVTAARVRYLFAWKLMSFPECHLSVEEAQLLLGI